MSFPLGIGPRAVLFDEDTVAKENKLTHYSCWTHLVHHPTTVEVLLAMALFLEVAMVLEIYMTGALDWAALAPIVLNNCDIVAVVFKFVGKMMIELSFVL